MERRDIIFKLYGALTMLLYNIDNGHSFDEEYNDILYLIDQYKRCSEDQKMSPYHDIYE